ncbi:hypothetical protein DPMN_061132 [Dreissena polymorpha]|uniref:Cyclic nucleotide-binding domain-containing protein n=1 Tax=Dreissena polymorpha TaxID=45954 RepID=A0A9D4C747_DREPO|nr:hypothetical protein DPMN_061132 [Dreissena polymorpha]
MRLKKIHSHFVRIFNAPPGERSERDICSVLPVVMMKTTCFRNLDADAVTYILQRATLERYKLDEVIVRQGEVGDKFYIILDGTVSIYVDAKKDEKVLRTMTEDNVMFPLPPPRRMSVATAISDRDGGEDLTVERHEIRGPHSTSSRKSRRESAQFGLRPQSRRHSSHGSHGSHDRVDHDKKDEDKDKRHRKKYGMAVNTLGRYQNFGELALIYPNRQRNASVIAEERTEVLVISYEIFEATLQDTLEQDLDEKRLFIQTHPFFSKWSFQMQRQLQWSLVRSTHSIGDPVIKQGSKLAGLCFLVRQV